MIQRRNAGHFSNRQKEIQHTPIANPSTVSQNPLQMQAEGVVLCCPCPAYGMPVKSVDFLGTGNHALRKQGADAWSNDKFGDDGDVTINYPEWQDNDLDGTADKDDPVCYTKSSSPKMTAVLAVSPNLTAAVSAKLKVKNGSATLVTKDVSLSGSETSVSDLTWAAASALPATLLTSDYTLTWGISLDGGTTYFDIGTSVNRFFVVLGTPNQANSFGSGNKLACRRISEVLDNAGTTADVGTIASNIQIWRDDFGITNNGATTGADGAKIWGLLDLTEKGQCAEGSVLMEQAIRLLGVSTCVTGNHSSCSCAFCNFACNSTNEST